MSAALSVLGIGLVTSVGLSAPATCAAMRAKISNPSVTRFADRGGEWMAVHAVALDPPRHGLNLLVQMAAMAIEEALAEVPRSDWAALPVLLCVAERDRPGRLDELEKGLFAGVENALQVRFAPSSLIVPHGRVSAAVALSKARELLHEQGCRYVLIAASDSLLDWQTLSGYDAEQRLLTSVNSDGFMPGEGAGAVLVGLGALPQRLVCQGIGFGVERAHLRSDEPLRADGLTAAIRMALADAGCELHDLHYRIADVSGEQYYFKEASLALSRTLRRVMPDFDLWNPAECTGELGAVAGLSVLACAEAASRKGYGKGPALLAHLANDAGQRAALALMFGGA